MKYRDRIYLETESDVLKFVNIAQALGDIKVIVTDAESEMRVNAKSMLGMLYAKTFDIIYCECDIDIYQTIKDFCE